MFFNIILKWIFEITNKIFSCMRSKVMNETKRARLMKRKFVLKIMITDRKILKIDFNSQLVTFLSHINYILFSWVVSQKLRFKVNFSENAILKKWARLRRVTLNIFLRQVESKKRLLHLGYIRHYCRFFTNKNKKIEWFKSYLISTLWRGQD